jgi:hypothetical protein
MRGNTRASEGEKVNGVLRKILKGEVFSRYAKSGMYEDIVALCCFMIAKYWQLVLPKGDEWKKWK